MTATTISHDRQEETVETKVRWFRSLPLAQRMELLCCFTDMILATDPKVAELRHAQPVAGRGRIVSLDDVRCWAFKSVTAPSHGTSLKEVLH